MSGRETAHRPYRQATWHMSDTQALSLVETNLDEGDLHRWAPVIEAMATTMLPALANQELLCVEIDGMAVALLATDEGIRVELLGPTTLHAMTLHVDPSRTEGTDDAHASRLRGVRAPAPKEGYQTLQGQSVNGYVQPRQEAGRDAAPPPPHSHVASPASEARALQLRSLVYVLEQVDRLDADASLSLVGPDQKHRATLVVEHGKLRPVLHRRGEPFVDMTFLAEVSRVLAWTSGESKALMTLRGEQLEHALLLLAEDCRVRGAFARLLARGLLQSVDGLTPEDELRADPHHPPVGGVLRGHLHTHEVLVASNRTMGRVEAAQPAFFNEGTFQPSWTLCFLDTPAEDPLWTLIDSAGTSSLPLHDIRALGAALLQDDDNTRRCWGEPPHAVLRVTEDSCLLRLQTSGAVTLARWSNARAGWVCNQVQRWKETGR